MSEIRIWEASIRVEDRYGNYHGSENFEYEDCPESRAMFTVEAEAEEMLEDFNIAGSTAKISLDGYYYDAAQNRHFVGKTINTEIAYKDHDYEAGEDR